MFSNADAYEHNTKRWSQRLAPLFIEFAGIRDGDRVLDVGCGTGSLSLALAGATRRAEIVGIDPSASFVEYARTRTTDPRLKFEVGNALKIPFPEASFDKTLALLVMQLIPEAAKARSGDSPGDSPWRRDGGVHLGLAGGYGAVSHFLGRGGRARSVGRIVA